MQIDCMENDCRKPVKYQSYNPIELQQIVDFCYQENIQLHCHVIGDMASSMVIEALENSKKKYSEIKNNQKNYLAHLELVRKVDFQKIYDVN